MMSSRRKQEEKHLQILKKNLQIECNKRCAECDQRGPTYVDVTIGSFVCTSCGGVLRGLNPAHRVKSVSMATFTPSEIALVETRGNDYCKKVYLGKYDPRSKAKPEAKHPAKLKYFLELKYEQKRWYVSPEQINKPLDSFMKSATSGAKQNRNMLESSKKVVPITRPSKPSVKDDGFASGANTFAPANMSNNNTSCGEGFADFSSAFATQSSDAFGDFTQTKRQNNDPSVSHAAKTPDFSSILAPMSTINIKQPPSSTASKPVDKYADLGDLFTVENTTSPTVWSGLSATGNNSSMMSNATNGVLQFGTASTQHSASSADSINRLQVSTFEVTQPSTTGFFNVQQQQPNIFGQPATATFAGVTQSNTMNVSQATLAFGNPQQAFSSGSQPILVYGNTQAMAAVTSQFNSTAAFGTTSQNSSNTMQPRTFGGTISAPASNPFVQSTLASSTQPFSGTNPFMASQQNPFPTQSAATNPFMQNPLPSQNQISTNPFF